MAPDKLSDYLEEYVSKRLDVLMDILQPSHEEHECFAYAWEVFIDHERGGFPYAGGSYEQPSLYMHVLDCVRTARNNAETLERQEEAHQSFLKEQEAEEERRRQELENPQT